LGAALDPVADKLMMLAAVILLASQGLVPVWLAVAIVMRDIVIVSEAVAYRWLISQVKIAPTLFSKLNTFLEFCVVFAVLASAAGLVDLRAWLPPFFVMVFLTVTVSGLHYVWVWGRKAARNARRAGKKTVPVLAPVLGVNGTSIRSDKARAEMRPIERA
jgi:cardiolipin synthase (CMP-forming)